MASSSLRRLGELITHGNPTEFAFLFRHFVYRRPGWRGDVELNAPDAEQSAVEIDPTRFCGWCGAGCGRKWHTFHKGDSVPFFIVACNGTQDLDPESCLVTGSLKRGE